MFWWFYRRFLYMHIWLSTLIWTLFRFTLLTWRAIEARLSVVIKPPHMVHLHARLCCYSKRGFFPIYQWKTNDLACNITTMTSGIYIIGSELKVRKQALLRAAADRLMGLTSVDVRTWVIHFFKSVCVIYYKDF